MISDEESTLSESYWTPGEPPVGIRSDPELLQYWREHIKAGYEYNDEMFRRILKAFLGPYYTTVWMNGIIFAVGILSFVSAVALSFVYGEALFALAFGGLSVAAFLGYFISRPMRSLEENLEFITWLGIIYNTYWTRVVAANDPETTQQDLQAATKDAITELDTMMPARGLRGMDRGGKSTSQGQRGR